MTLKMTHKTRPSHLRNREGIIGNEYVIHGLQHSLRDRLRAVECPSDITDQIGGWATEGVGHGYGRGCSLEVMTKWMRKIEA
jgi:hypothetical protein